MVDRGGLENRWARKGPGGSNPSLTAIKKLIKELNIIGTEKICSVVALMNGSKLLIGLRHYTPDKWKKTSVWTLPGGRCDKGETLGQTLTREVAEEVGITEFQISEFLGKAPGAKDGDMVYTFIGQTKQEPKLMEPLKFSEWKWAEIDKISTNFINTEVLDLIKKTLNNLPRG